MYKTRKVIFVAWQSPVKRSWHTVGKLTSVDGEYLFEYTVGARFAESFVPFSGMDDLGVVYKSKELFPFFSNRILPSRRPEYKSFLSWIGLGVGEDCPMVVFEKAGGYKNTDNIQLFPEIVVDEDGRFELEFFAHGIKYLSEDVQERITKLETGARLYLLPDLQNDFDEFALAIRSEGPAEIIGYCPRYFAQDLGRIILRNRRDVSISVARINQDAPTNYQLMCRVEGWSKENKKIFMDRDFLSIAST